MPSFKFKLQEVRKDVYVFRIQNYKKQRDFLSWNCSIGMVESILGRKKVEPAQLGQLPSIFYLLRQYKIKEATANNPPSKSNGSWMSSIKRTTVPKIAAPPTQIARELNQQQLVPTKKASRLPSTVFLCDFMVYLVALKEILLTLEAMSFASSLSRLKFIVLAIFITFGSVSMSSKGNSALDSILMSLNPASFT